ncbi:WD-40 repeat protein [Candidatus Moduliflexus flocculans]|uniref:WD-40 repeat protein n=1 Tax=Candidatus Moduliflexus flocculans TaxID=1499966 RepID=A0A0S6VXA5_9BACT|nr:WD-40 repeat protein [Candidatus Moduliflexus flocculans]
MQLVRPGEGTEDFRRIATRSELGEDLWRLTIKLAHARLVVTNRQIHASSGQSVETVEIVHEALLRHWERLRDWRETERHFRAWQERVRSIMQQSQAQAKQGWQLFERQYDRDFVLRGKSLKEAKQWLKRKRTEVSADEQRFIAYCKRTLFWQGLQRKCLAAFVGIGLGVVYVILRSIFFWFTNK